MRAFVLIIAAWLLLLPAHADEVTVPFDGFDLVGNLLLAGGKSLKSDGVVLILHDQLGTAAAEPVIGLQTRLSEQGYNTLAINLSLSIDHRNAAFSCSGEQDHRYEDALPEIHAWVRWLQSSGASDITLAGFGLGANQIALYATKTTQKAVRRVVLISPLTWAQARTGERYQQRFKASLPQLLLEVEQKIAEDAGGTLLEGVGFLNCDNAVVTARSFVSYYRDLPYFNTPGLIPLIKIPTLVVASELDDVSPDLMINMQQVPARPNLSFDVIEGADRAFSTPFNDHLATRTKLFIDASRGQ